ncbi:hypothetical protein ADL00_07005 [Streptomyces sp. AS58]|uniref:hypothetical protein n=1 Tax=Streptomyces sp. AS58 TaxID=1519489 RepID=UPI0006AE929A|nr:hypothetical protein [Streptomyces sp. AS58]KOV71837.1 hypothetical protein ADL00_07005 [Streptomyces sp. AS58]
MLTDRRLLGTGPVRADASRTRDTDLPVPRAQLAAERLPATPAATGPKPPPADGRRALGAGPGEAGR